MFHAASLKLTIWYLGFIMLLSFAFSVAFYRVSVAELDRGLLRQSSMLRNLPPVFDTQILDLKELARLRLDQIEESKNHILFGLLYFNLSVFFLGGLGSYLLARRTLEPIEEALNAQNRFTADASHELRTPLTAMRTEIEVALRDKDLSLTESKQLHKSTLEEIEHLDTLSSHLLKLAGQTHRASQVYTEEISLKECVEGAILVLDKKIKQREIKLEVDLHELKMLGDSTGVTELVTILLDNAVKYSPPKNKVLLSLKAENRWAVFKVKDEGVGIPATDIPHIFERFYRADSARAKEGAHGYGLGLSIAHQIVESHDGKITVESSEGKGSTFIVRLPLENKKRLLASGSSQKDHLA